MKLKRFDGGDNVVVAAGVAWFLQGLISLVLPDPTWVLDITMIVPLTLTFFAIRQLLAVQSAGKTRLGQIALVISGVMAIATPVGQIGLAADPSGFTWLAIVLALGLTVGLILTGIITLRARRVPKWVGISLILSQFGAVIVGLALSPISPLADHGDYTGAMTHGMIWFLIGYKFFDDRSKEPGVATWSSDALQQA